MIALGVAYALLPKEELNVAATAPQESSEPAVQLTAYDTFSAMRSIYDDASGFCERNPETCVTGMAILNDLESRARQGLAKFSKPAEETSTPAADLIQTGSVE